MISLSSKAVGQGICLFFCDRDSRLIKFNLGEFALARGARRWRKAWGGAERNPRKGLWKLFKARGAADSRMIMNWYSHPLSPRSAG